jgi:hypothetical protein
VLRPADAPRPSSRSADPAGTVALLVGLVLVLPLAIGSLLWVAPGTGDRVDPNRWVAVTPVDALSLLVLLVWARDHGRPVLRASTRRLDPLLACALGLGVLLVVALAVHPSPRGFELVIRVAAAAALADSVRRLADPRSRRILLAAVVVSGALQAVLGMAQSLHGGPLGLPRLELEGRLYHFGSSFAGRGSFDHPFHLACWLTVACGAGALGLRRDPKPWPWALGLAVCSCGLAVTYSRAALLGMAAACAAAVVVTVVRRDRRAAAVVGAVVVGFFIGITAFGSGWVARADTSASASSVDSGRRDRAAEAVRLIRTEPVVGVGPGRYVLALDHVPHRLALPAHDLSLQVAAEEGIAAGVLVTIALGLLTVRCFRRGLDALLVLLPPLPFLLLDVFPYAFPLGIASSGIWLGLLGAGWTGRRATGPAETTGEAGADRDEPTADAVAVPA